MTDGWEGECVADWADHIVTPLAACRLCHRRTGMADLLSGSENFPHCRALEPVLVRSGSTEGHGQGLLSPSDGIFD